MVNAKSLAPGYMSLPCSAKLYPELNSNCYTTTSFNDAYNYFVFSFIFHNVNENNTGDLWLSIYSRYINNVIDGMLNHIYNNLQCSSVVFISSGVTKNEISRLRMWAIYNSFVSLLNRKYRDLKCIWVLPENNECFSKAPLLDLVKKEIENKRISKHGQLQKDENTKLTSKDLLNELSRYITSQISKYHEELSIILQSKTPNSILSEYITKFKGTFTELANMIGCDKAQISKYMSQKNLIRKKERAIALAIALQLNDKDLFFLVNGTGFEFPVDERDNLLIHYVHQNPDYNFEETVSLIDSMFPDKLAIVPDQCGINEEKQMKRSNQKDNI